jgi:hypothetical protein
MGEGWLRGWKDVANYLRCSVRTAKRYHYEGNMPVNRPEGMSIWALKGEIDIWMVEYVRKAKRRGD